MMVEMLERKLERDLFLVVRSSMACASSPAIWWRSGHASEEDRHLALPLERHGAIVKHGQVSAEHYRHS